MAQSVPYLWNQSLLSGGRGTIIGLVWDMCLSLWPEKKHVMAKTPRVPQSRIRILSKGRETINRHKRDLKLLFLTVEEKSMESMSIQSPRSKTVSNEYSKAHYFKKLSRIPPHI